MYKGTQAKDTKFVYNDVKNITKESVELHNSYRSSSKGMGVGVNTSFGSDGKAKGTTVNISASRSNLNTDETIHHNGSFSNVDEVHNNTETMIIRGFNQEGGKVTGNIGKLEIESVQNTSTTTGSSRGVNIGISSSGVPTSGSINASRTNGSRAYVDKQSSFVIGEGSSLTIGRVENTGAIIGKEGNSSLKINEYTGKDIHNHDTMKTVGITAGTDGAGVNYENSVKEGITRNTVIGSPEIGRAEGAPINTDISKANETTREEHRKTNVFLEPQTIDYAMNPGKFKEDFEVAVLEGKATGEAILKTIENLVNGRKSSDMADPERRTLNEIKESIIRVKTAPQMESIAEAKDLNSPDVLKELGIAAIEKYDPYDPNLPIKVRQRVEKTLEDGEIPGVFYDKTTNKIFVYKGMEDDLEIRAGIAREWKISEDLKDGKGKPNEEGRVKATVAGELAYDDMLKRGREGKTGSISTDRFADAVMDEDSEVTADNLLKDIKKGLTDTAKWIKNTPVYKEGEKIVKNPIGYSVSVGKQVGNEIGYRSIQGWNEVNKIGASKEKREQLDRNTQNAKADRNRRNKEAVAQEEKERQQIEQRKNDSNNQTKPDFKLTEKNKQRRKIDVIEIGKGAVFTATGIAGALSEDMTYGFYKPMEIDEPTYHLGKLIGHTVSTIGGTLGTGGGKILEESGVVAVPATGGLSLGITGAGYIVSGYSAGVAVNGVKGVVKSTANLTNSNNTSSSSGSSINNNEKGLNASNNDNLDELNDNDINHIKNGSKNSNHKWEKLVPDKNWEKMKNIIREVLENGNEKEKNSRHQIFENTLEIDGHKVQVRYKKFPDGTIKVSDGWIVE